MSTKDQTSVSYELDRGIEGGFANSKPAYVSSHVAEETIKTGRFVKLGTDVDKQILNIAATGDVALGKLIGVTVHDRTRETPALLYDDTGGEGIRDFAAKEDVSVMSEGAIYMKPETAMTFASTPYIRHAGRAQVQTLVIDTDLVAGDVVSGKVGGVSIAPVTYGSSNADTLTALAAAIVAAGTNVLAVSNGTTTITVTTLADSSDEDLTTFVVTSGGAGTAVMTTAETATSVHTDNIGRLRNDSDTSTATAAPTGSVRVLESIAANAIGSVSIKLN